MMGQVLLQGTSEHKGRLTRVGLLSGAFLVVLFLAESDFKALGSSKLGMQQATNGNVGTPTVDGLIDGSIHPELIPDDRAYHLVLLAASASDDDSEVDKARADAVVNTILLKHRADAPALAGIANRYRGAVRAHHERASGAVDAVSYERARQDLVVAARRDAEVKLSAEARDALRIYVEREKRNMKLFPLPDMRTHTAKAASGFFSMPAVHAQGPSCGELGGIHCSQSGSCPPNYTSLGPTSDPCNPCCQPSGPSCGELGGDHCSQSGNCPFGHNDLGHTHDCHPCCQSQPAMDPSGSTYGGTAIGGATYYATGITDARSSCGCHQSSVAVNISAPWGGTHNSSVGGEYVQTTAAYAIHSGEFDVEDDIEVTTESYAYCPIISAPFITSVTVIRQFFSTFTAIFRKSHFNAFIGKWVYVKDVSMCNGQCQPPQWCSTQECNWIYVNGLRVNTGTGLIFCQPIPPYPRCAATPPRCKQVFGGLIWGGDFECN